jgi:hypothetical protein
LRREIAMNYNCEKPAIVFYRERIEKPDREAFAVIKAQRLSLAPVPQGEGYEGVIEDFFPLMGDIEPVTSDAGREDRYILCWTDDAEEDPDRSWKRLIGVTFPDEIDITVNERGKKTYNAKFSAAKGKIT